MACLGAADRKPPSGSARFLLRPCSQAQACWGAGGPPCPRSSHPRGTHHAVEFHGAHDPRHLVKLLGRHGEQVVCGLQSGRVTGRGEREAGLALGGEAGPGPRPAHVVVGLRLQERALFSLQVSAHTCKIHFRKCSPGRLLSPARPLSGVAWGVGAGAPAGGASEAVGVPLPYLAV